MKDIWPTAAEVEEVIAEAITSEMFTDDYADVFAGDERWQSLPTPEGDTFEWDAELDVRAAAAVLRRHARGAGAGRGHHGARVLLKLGDSVTTDHISPGRCDQEGLARRASTSASTAWSSGTSTPTAPVAATTR